MNLISLAEQLENMRQQLKLHGGLTAGASLASVTVAAVRISRNTSPLIMQCCPCTSRAC